ncbi:MAG: hypothetical protein IPH45_09625 [Bacteroidales bacterium]|nr:hypothetical protein [Bacteroidales bacterium]MBK7172595.1 hypothetical protein [Bacteroidales bacterium]
MKEVRILGVYVNDRVKDAALIQPILTKYGCSIRTRLGLHSLEDIYAVNTGLIILELVGSQDECLRLENELLSIDQLDVQKMTFRK